MQRQAQNKKPPRRSSQRARHVSSAIPHRVPRTAKLRAEEELGGRRECFLLLRLLCLPLLCLPLLCLPLPLHSLSPLHLILSCAALPTSLSFLPTLEHVRIEFLVHSFLVDVWHLHCPSGPTIQNMAGTFGPYSNHPSTVPGFDHPFDVPNFVDNDWLDLCQEVPPPGPRAKRSVSSRSHDSGYGGSSEGRSRLATPVLFSGLTPESEASAISPKGQAAPHPLGDHYCQAYTHHGHIQNNNCTTPFTASWDSAAFIGRLLLGSNGHIAQSLPALININGPNFGSQVNGSKDMATNETKAECVANRSEKGKNLNDAPWCYSEGSVEASDEGEDDSDHAYESITTSGGFRSDQLPSFLPYLHSQETNTPSPYADSPESGSSSIGTAGQDTPASSISYQSGRNGVRRLGQSPLGAATGSSNDSTPPTIVVEGENRAKATPRQPLPFICWYVAAGEACPAKYVKRSTETRHLWQ